ncbi:MAG: VacJ family lipoprotein [Rhodobacteraceae bacterium]|nr:VacJ family lipoprotein [Paracoccaceae bacterium]
MLRFSLLATLVFLMGCAAAPDETGFYDPLEGLNRGVHGFNKGVDTLAFRPVSQVYGTVVPAPVRTGVDNFSDNLGLPGVIVNNALQGDLESAASNTGRFLVNSTFGLLGFLDPATELGTPERSTDFGETLHVWGVGEGAYVELPVLGPSTARDAAGFVVDVFLDPLDTVLESPESDYRLGARGAEIANTRYRFGDTVDGILYESADSYAQSRLIYLQNRRFELGIEDPSSSLGPADTDGSLYDDLYFE